MVAQRIDVHHHFVPSFYSQALVDNGGDPSGFHIPTWTPEDDIKFNEEEKTAFTFLSITTPGASILPPEKQAGFCRQLNEYAAGLRAEHPTRYGFFAVIPSLLETGAALDEINHALDSLGADGVVLYSRYGAGNHYLGHADFAPVWDLLDARAAAVLVHPTHPVDTAAVSPSLPQPVVDFPHETTRAAIDLITSGTVRSHPNVRVILSHAGGTLPYLAMRPASILPYLPGRDETQSSSTSTADFLEDARSFYFDTALSAAPLTLDLLKGFARPGHVLFGSDYPYAPEPAIRQMHKMLDEYEEGDGGFVRSLSVEAAVALFPRLGSIVGS